MNEHLSSQQLSDLVEGLLPPDHARAVQAHLAACAGCRQALAQRRALVERLRREVPACLAQVTPPPTLRWEHARRRVPFKQRSLVMLRYVRTATVSIAVISLFVVLALGLNALLRQASSPAQPDGYEVSAEETVSSSHPKSTFFFTPISLSLQSDLPPVVNELPLYRVEPALLEVSVQQVRLWAERLDMGTVRVYRTNSPDDAGPAQDVYVALNADWNGLVLYPDGLSFSHSYSPLFTGDFWFWNGTKVVDQAEAQALARAFLEPLLPYLITVAGTPAQISFALVSEKEPGQPKTSLHRYYVVPQLNGVSLVVPDWQQNFIAVAPDGHIGDMHFTPLHVSPAGETASPRPVDAALQDVLDGKSEYLSRLDWGTWEKLPQEEFYFRSRSYREDKIVVIGRIEWLQGLEGEDDLVLLSNYSSSPPILILEGDNVKPYTQQFVQVWGTLSDLDYQQIFLPGRLQVERVETTGFPTSGEWEGQARWRDGALWLETTSGQELLLPRPPAELADGARVWARGALAYNDSQRLEWTAIYTDLAKQILSASRLLDYDLNIQDASLNAKNPKLNLTLWWHVQDPILENVNLFVHLLNPKTGELVAQRDVVQSQGQEDTMRRVSQTLEIALNDVPPGDYNLVIGYYDQKTGARLRLTGLVGDSTPDGQLVLPDVVKVLPDGEVQVARAASDTPQTVVQKVELAYHVPQFTYTPEPQPVLTEPVYLFDIYSPPKGYRLLVYVSAVD